MAHLLIMHRVEDYAKWRAVFDDKIELRRESGEMHAHVFRNADDPSNLVVLFDWDSLENARAYSQDPRLRAAMQEAGVSGPPTVVFLDEA